MDRGHGFKFLNQYGATQYQGKDFIYPLPHPDQKWGAWIEHPDPAEPDGLDCGPGRFHVMRKLSADYAPPGWWPWFCEWEGEIGESKEKVGARRLRLRRIPRKVFWKILRNGDCARADLRGANLRGANLMGADLRGANLRGANLMGADLTGANLTGAYLMGANLRRADLTEADLMGANLRRADLTEADLTGANLTGADLTGANLMGAIGYEKQEEKCQDL
jgi:hypothetical protein